MDIIDEIETTDDLLSESRQNSIDTRLCLTKIKETTPIGAMPLPWLERLGQTLAQAILLQTNLEILLAELPKPEAPPTCGHPMADREQPHGGWPVRDTTLPNVGEVETV